jgi:hypothetical protein
VSVEVPPEVPASTTLTPPVLSAARHRGEPARTYGSSLAAARVVVNGVVENRRSEAPVELLNGAEAGAVFVDPAREKHYVVLRGPRALKSSGITVESLWMRCGNNHQRDVRPITGVISAV